jgi:hypothetical protein
MRKRLDNDTVMKWISIVATVMLFVMIFIKASVSYAQGRPPVCLHHEMMSSKLKDGGEELFMMGEVNNAPMLVQIWVNQETGVWTAIVLSVTNMRACIVSHGTNFETIPFKRKEHKHGA